MIVGSRLKQDFDPDAIRAWIALANRSERDIVTSTAEQVYRELSRGVPVEALFQLRVGGELLTRRLGLLDNHVFGCIWSDGSIGWAGYVLRTQMIFYVDHVFSGKIPDFLLTAKTSTPRRTGFQNGAA
jgi:hypothetical protein